MLHALSWPGTIFLESYAIAILSKDAVNGEQNTPRYDMEKNRGR